MMTQITTIHERTTSLPKQGDAATNTPVVSGVKVLGIESKNGRKYPIEVMRKALEKYEGAIVNIDHPAGSEPRSYEDRFGRLTNARMEADGIYADLAYNPKHPLAEGFQWWVKNDPKAIGLSHNAQAKTKMNTEGVEEIEEIVKVDSVDLVAEPATTAGLMECVMRAKETKQPVVESDASKIFEASEDAMIDQLKKASVGLPSKGGHNLDSAKKAAASMLRTPHLIPKIAAAGINFFSSIAKDLDAKGEKSPFHPNYKNLLMDAKATKNESKTNKKLRKVRTTDRQNLDSFYSIGQGIGVQHWGGTNGVVNGYDKDGDLIAKFVGNPKEVGEKNDKFVKGKSEFYFYESKPTKKLNVTEAKKRKAYKRMLVSEAIKEILTIRKGV
jgi:hypothetical protein